MSWVYVSLSIFGGMPWWLAGLAAFLFCTVMALFPTLAGTLFKRWRPDSPWRQAMLFAALIAAVDWLCGWIFTGFPWLTVGYSQSPPSPLVGFALPPFATAAQPTRPLRRFQKILLKKPGIAAMHSLHQA